MRGSSSCSKALAILFLAMVSSGHAATAESPSSPARDFESHYIVFEIDADGVPRPMSHRIVRLAQPAESMSDAAIGRRLAAASRGAEPVVVRVLTPEGGVAFQDVVEIPRWVNVETGL